MVWFLLIIYYENKTIGGKKLELLKWVHNKKSRNIEYKKSELSGFSSEEMKEVYEFHKSLPDYQPTPLVDL